MRLDHAAALAGLVCLLLLAGWIGWALARNYYEPVAIVEKPAAPVWHDDGTLTAMKDPAGKLSQSETSAPEGGKILHTVEFTVKPDPIPAEKVAEHTNEKGEVECPPLDLRIDMRDYGNQGVRFSGNADGGEILDGIHVPKSVVYVHDIKRNIIGLDLSGDRKTIRYGRALGDADLGIQASEEGGKLEPGVWVMYRFN